MNERGFFGLFFYETEEMFLKIYNWIIYLITQSFIDRWSCDNICNKSSNNTSHNNVYWSMYTHSDTSDIHNQSKTKKYSSGSDHLFIIGLIS